MQTMLRGLAGQGISTETVRRILAAFPEPHNLTQAGSGEVMSLTANAGLLEPLTGRELDVLVLLRERLSNKEIAHRLGSLDGNREASHCQPLCQAWRRQALGRRDPGRGPQNPPSALITRILHSWPIALHPYYTLRW